MKKIIFALLLAVSAAWATPANALGFDWGVTAGLNLTKLKMKKDASKLLSSDNRAGWFLGLKANLSIAAGFGVDGSILYSQKKYHLYVDDNTSVNDYTNSMSTSRSIAIPINFRYSIGIGSVASVYIATGPQFDFYCGDKKLGEFFENDNMSTSWNIGAGVRLLKHLEVGLGYNFALGKTGESILSNTAGSQYIGSSDNYRANTFQVQVAYFF